MNFVKCQFCQKPCRIVQEGNYRFTGSSKYYRCDYHGAVVVKHIIAQDSYYDFAQTILSVLYKDATYDVSLFYGRTDDIKFRIDKVNIPPRTIETVITLDFHPDITPENIESKLATYILFS